MRTTSEREWHPASKVYPLLADEELDALVEDIREHGLRVPILVDKQGRIIDGRNRQTACILAGVTPRYETFSGDDEETLQLVVSLNHTRRHLDKSELAACGALAKGYLESVRSEARKRQGERNDLKRTSGEKSPEVNRSRDEIGKQFGVDGSYIERAEKLKDEAPELFEQVHTGKLKLSEAKRKVEVAKREAKRKEDAKQAEKILRDEQPPWLLIQQEVIDGLQSVVAHHGPARLIFTDPPYNIGIDYGEGAKADRRPDYMLWVAEWIDLCVECLAPDGSLWVMIGDEYAAEYAMALKSQGLHIRSWIKWYETFGVNCSNNFNRTSRHIFYCVRDKKHFVFNADVVSRPSDRQTKYNDARAADGGKVWDDVWTIPRLVGNSAERIDGFPTQLPLALVEPIILCASNPGDLVIDPFNGSGTTGVAAIRHGRKYIGIDQSEAYIDAADERLKAEWHKARAERSE